MSAFLDLVSNWSEAGAAEFIDTQLGAARVLVQRAQLLDAMPLMADEEFAMALALLGAAQFGEQDDAEMQALMDYSEAVIQLVLARLQS